MVLEKLSFLEQAIRIAKDEILEELSTMEEGADFSKSKSIIARVITDLFDSSENFSSLSLEESLDGFIESKASVGEISYLFNVGDQVRVVNGAVTPRIYRNFSDYHGYPETYGDYPIPPVKVGKKGTILARGKHLRFDESAEFKHFYYIIEFEDSTFLIRDEDECNLQKIL